MTIEIIEKFKGVWCPSEKVGILKLILGAAVLGICLGTIITAIAISIITF